MGYDINTLIVELKASYPPIQDVIPMAKKTTNSQYNAPCFLCGGEDRLIIDIINGRYLCRQCEIKGDIIDYYRETGCGDLKTQLIAAGLTGGKGETVPDRLGSAGKKKSKIEFAWNKSVSSSDIMKRYFEGRGITDFVSPAVRFGSWKQNGETVCRVIASLKKPGDTELKAVHSIFLDTSGNEIVKEKKISQGEQSGRAVWLDDKDKRVVIIGEGLENTLAFRQEVNLPGSYTAALTTSGMKGIVLPEETEKLYILCDQDTTEKGCAGQKAAMQLAKRFEKGGGKVWIVSPSDECFAEEVTKKLDFNDLLGQGLIIERLKAKKRPGELKLPLSAKEINKKNNRSDNPDTINYPPDTLNQLNDLNSKYAACLLSGKFRIAREYYNDAMKFHTVEFIEKGAFDNFLANRECFVYGAGGEQKKTALPKAWLQWGGRRSFESVIFDPTMQADHKSYNLFRGFAIKPKKGEWGLLKQHIHKVLCCKNDKYMQYIMAWMARIIQAPGSDRPGVAVVLLGGKGVGKGTLANCLGRIIGESYVPVSSSKGLTGDFNMHLAKALVVFADEAVWGGDKQAEGRLKHLITDPTCDFEPKGIDKITLPCHANLIIASNEPWVVPASADERRYFVLEIPEQQLPRRYFDDLYRQMENGGYAAMMYDLMEYDYTAVSLRDSPKTAGLSEQVKHSFDSVHVFWLNILERGFILSEKKTGEPKNTAAVYITGTELFPCTVFKYEIFHEFSEIHEAKSKYSTSAVTFWKTTKRLFNPSERQVTHDGKRIRVMDFPAYKKMASLFEECTGVKIHVHEDEQEGVPF